MFDLLNPEIFNLIFKYYSNLKNDSKAIVRTINYDDCIYYGESIETSDLKWIRHGLGIILSKNYFIFFG
jgi:hypothetical protein